MSTQPNTTDLDRLEALAKVPMRAATAMEAAKGLTALHDAATPAAILELIQLARRSQPVATSSIKTWQERCAEKYPTITGGVLAPWAKLQCATAEIADLRAALATQQAAREQQEPVAIYQARAAFPDAGWSDLTRDKWDEVGRAIGYERRIVYAAPVAQQSEAVSQALDWLDAALKCKDFHWDGDQRGCAQWALDEARKQSEAGAPTAAASVRDGMEKAAQALGERAAGHYRNGDYELQDECLQCAAMVRDMKPLAPTSGRESAAPVAEQDAKDAGALEMALVINRKLGDVLLGRSYLLPDDLAALRRFEECASDFDSGGHDVSKNAMARLREIGVVQSIGFGRHQTTAFGDYVLERTAGEPVSLPLMTLAERNAAMQKGAQDNG